MYQLPDDSTLFQSLSGILKPAFELVDITERKQLTETSTYPVERVVGQMADGTVQEFFCKYLAGGGPNAFGHRGGVEYESLVYQKILAGIPLSKIHFYGESRIANNDMVVVLEFLGHYLRFVKSGDPDGLVKAASWIGAFHRLMEGESPDFIRKYDLSYYQSWMDHFRKVNARLWESHPALEQLVALFSRNLWMLTDTPHTIIHGEYYPRNVLMKQGVIYPVDWESAAIAPGEIDLASLIEDWPAKEALRTIEAYTRARWDVGEKDEKAFLNRLLMARIYFFIRYCPWNTAPEDWIANKWIYRNMMDMISEAEKMAYPLHRSAEG